MMHIIDLSHPYYEGMPQYREKFECTATVKSTTNSEGLKNIYKLELMTQSGTHIKAPNNLIYKGRAIEHIPLEHFFHLTSIIHLPEKREKDLITFEDIQQFYIKSGDGVVIHTGWSAFWENGKYFIDFPLITSDAVQYLIEEKNIAFLGTDTPVSSEVKRLLFKNDLFVIENLTNLDQINLNRFYLIALPINVYSSDSAPARVVALENDNFII